MFSVEIKPAIRVNLSDLATLRRLTYKDGSMQDVLCASLIHQTTVAMLRNSKGTIIAWAAKLEDKWYRANLHVFVDSRYRRRGYGSLLLSELAELTNESIMSWPYDDRSRAFFAYNGFSADYPSGRMELNV